MINALLFWLILITLFFIAYTLGMRRAAARLAAQRAVPPILPTAEMAAIEARLEPLMFITGRKAVGGVFQFEGHLKGQADETFRQIRAAFADEPVTPMLLEGENDVRVMVLPGQMGVQGVERPKWALHWLLFAATMATTTWAGALDAGVNLLQQPGRFAVGLPYSLGLLLILGSHEMGHYFTAKKHGIQVTPPFFIPVPFALGTFGAFIKIKSLTPDRRALFDVAIAGPLAGLVFAIPALFVGLHFSHLAQNANGAEIGSSAFHAKISLDTLGFGHLPLHPLAFAGWLGLIVTALNLLPIGQLDGGHMSHALFGSRHAHVISIVALVLLFLLALFVWPELMFWAFIVFFIAGTRDAPAANDVTPLGPGRKLLGYFTFLLLLLIIVLVLFETVGLRSPYS